MLGFLKSNDTYDPDRLAADQQKLRAFLPDAGLCRLPRQHRACRTDPGSPRFRHHLCDRGRAALSLRHGRCRQRPARLAGDAGQAAGRRKAGQLVQREAGRRFGHRAQRSRRQSRLCLRRHRPDLRARCRKAADEHHLPGQGHAARLRRADRHHRQHDHPRQGHPPRVPHQRRRRVQRCQAQAQPGPHPEPRLFPGEVRDQADAKGRLPTASCWASMSRRNRPASCRCRAVIRASSGSSSSWRSRRTISAAWASRSTPRSISRAIPSRSKPVSPTPISSTSRSCSAASCSAAITAASISSATSARRPIRRSAPGGGLRLGFPITEFMNFGARYTLSRDKVSLNRNTFFTDPDGNGPLELSATRSRPAGICATKSADGSRRCSAIRRFRQHRRHSPDARHPRDHCLAGFRRPWRRREVSAQPDRRDQIPESRRRMDRVAARRRRLYPARAESHGAKGRTRSG